jgi:hypothetical protein
VARRRTDSGARKSGSQVREADIAFGREMSVKRVFRCPVAEKMRGTA